MPTIPDDFAHVQYAIQQTGDPDPYLITFGASRGAEGDPQEMVNEINDALNDVLKPHYDDSWTLGGTTMRLDDNGEESIYVAPTTVEGEDSSRNYVPQNSAILIHKRTTRGGRRGRGRLYMPGVIEGSVSPLGRLNNDYLADWQTIADNMLDALNSDPLETVGMWLLHSPSGEDVENPTAEGAPNEVVALTVDPVIATQRRRLRH